MEHITANMNHTERAVEPNPGLYLISDEEMKLIRRLRQLQTGSHLVIIQADAQGVFGLTVLQSGKLEKLRKQAEQV